MHIRYVTSLTVMNGGMQPCVTSPSARALFLLVVLGSGTSTLLLKVLCRGSSTLPFTMLALVPVRCLPGVLTLGISTLHLQELPHDLALLAPRFEYSVLSPGSED